MLGHQREKLRDQERRNKKKNWKFGNGKLSHHLKIPRKMVTLILKVMSFNIGPCEYSSIT